MSFAIKIKFGSACAYDFLIVFADRKIEPIPGLLQDLIDSLMSKQVFPVKPDSCMIDIFNEVASDYISSSSNFFSSINTKQNYCFTYSVGRPLTAKYVAPLVWAASMCAVFDRMRYYLWEND